jgi:hypothetical protein
MLSNNYVFYEGPSELDGTPIVAIANNFKGAGGNAKLGGNFIQTWILCAEMDPLSAMLASLDLGICGYCSLSGFAGRTGPRPGRKCYVPPGRTPLPIWKQWQRGRTPTIKERRLAPMFAGRGIRLGSYGDPAAVPLRIWRKVMTRAAYWTGYTHQWRTCHLSYKRWCMASCDTEEDRRAAHAMGWRTFRTTRMNSYEARQPGEIVCPKSKEAGQKVTCEQCRICSGTDGDVRQTDVVITLHSLRKGT